MSELASDGARCARAAIVVGIAFSVPAPMAAPLLLTGIALSRPPVRVALAWALALVVTLITIALGPLGPVYLLLVTGGLACAVAIRATA